MTSPRSDGRSTAHGVTTKLVSRAELKKLSAQKNEGGETVTTYVRPTSPARPSTPLVRIYG
eukprot:CAMPEP_0181235664 /NCGR_PEP_ID=MMETSP1096-20121128/37709_1 /TAXON_ID=156174 ORGANISM="Chrysochromulina ericina, Strain CCMP281" /NCGR_SAMPLE_ID=MMETSP1096 /ASSEMBLY_ACC=CAM_ASM_000453 /LENGTH=60 /DNA_ID=CAMNT_0023330685 /DNA_START=98 /DNA_END=280 /DNA_ORIENTATION=-